MLNENIQQNQEYWRQPVSLRVPWRNSHNLLISHNNWVEVFRAYNITDIQEQFPELGSDDEIEEDTKELPGEQDEFMVLQALGSNTNMADVEPVLDSRVILHHTFTFLLTSRKYFPISCTAKRIWIKQVPLPLKDLERAELQRFQGEMSWAWLTMVNLCINPSLRNFLSFLHLTNRLARIQNKNIFVKPLIASVRGIWHWTTNAKWSLNLKAQAEKLPFSRALRLCTEKQPAKEYNTFAHKAPFS